MLRFEMLQYLGRSEERTTGVRGRSVKFQSVPTLARGDDNISGFTLRATLCATRYMQDRPRGDRRQLTREREG